MNASLSIICCEDYFVCAICPNESAWETLRVDGTDRLSLYFHVGGGAIRNDAFAKERFEANDPAAFGNFYETILDSKRTFRRFEVDLDPIELLHDVIQGIKVAYFERMHAFDDRRDALAEIPANFCFVSGIHRDAKDRIRALFAGEGFLVEPDADYLEAFLKSLQRKAIVPSRVNLAMAESSFGDLRFHYIECNDGIVRRESELVVGRGVDYRVGNLARLIVEKAARRSSSRILNDSLLLEQEIKHFHRRAAEEIEKFEYDELDLSVELSDFSSARVIIDRRELDRMSSDSFQFLKFHFEKFISKYSNLARTEKILLNGSLLASGECIRFFERTFGASKVIPPFGNFIELLSRGVFAITSDLPVSTEKQVEIKITVTTKVVPSRLPEAPSALHDPPKRPPVPVRRPGVGAQAPAPQEPDRRDGPPPETHTASVEAPPVRPPLPVRRPGVGVQAPTVQDPDRRVGSPPETHTAGVEAPPVRPPLPVRRPGVGVQVSAVQDTDRRVAPPPVPPGTRSVVKAGDQVEAVVLEVHSKDRRISLGLKQLEPNPWTTIDSRYSVGSVVEGRVRNMTDFGAFIEIEEGIDGLVHVSDLSWTKRIKHPSEILKNGMIVQAVILNIDSASHRLSLGIKQLQPVAWESYFQNHQVGDTVHGLVCRLATFGAFIELAEGVEGLCHFSEVPGFTGRRAGEAPPIQIGEEHDFKIIKMSEAEKKIGLSMRAVTADKDVVEAGTRTASEGGPPKVPKGVPLPPPRGLTRDSDDKTERPPGQAVAPPARVTRTRPTRLPPLPPLPPTRKT